MGDGAIRRSFDLRHVSSTLNGFRSHGNASRAPPVPDDEIVAPTVIPDTIPVVEKQFPPMSLAPAPEAVEGGGAGGSAGGVGGSTGGEVGGKVGGVPGGIAEDGRVHIERKSCTS